MAENKGLSKSTVLVIILVVIVALVLWESWYTIDEGERGVLLTNGSVSSVENPGLHFKIPMFQSVVMISTRTQTFGGEPLPMYSYDQQTADLTLSVTYHIAPEQVRDVYTRFGEDGLFRNGIYPRVTEVSKSVFGQFTAARAIQEREELNREMNSQIKAALSEIPIVVENIQIENVDFSDTYERAVEQAAKAKADVERAKSELARVEQEAQQKVKNAEAEAQATRATAEAAAYSTKVKGEAEAEAIRARGAALRDNPDMIKLIQAERWNGILPTTMVPGAALPFVNVTH